MHRSLFALPLLLMAACTEPERTPEVKEQEHAVSAPTHRTIDLNDHGMPLVVEVDQQVLGADTVITTWNEQLGRLEVNAGERFRITITEEEGDLERLKGDLDRDMLRKNTVLEGSADMVIYRSEFPDDAATFIHFYRIVKSDGREFVIQSHDQGRFNEADVRRMAAAVRPSTQA